MCSAIDGNVTFPYLLSLAFPAQRIYGWEEIWNPLSTPQMLLGKKIHWYDEEFLI
jgi:hypothetical protein